MMTQTLAILVDAYRELQSRKMFWTVIILNILAMLAFALFGANDHAMTFLWFEPFGRFLKPVDYKTLYSNVVVGIWFTWIATILALVSTAGIFPELMTSGSIDMYLAKPISRLRLFFTKYLSGLLFVLLQVFIFAGMSYLVLGIRGGIWEPGLFLAIPLVVLFYSYLFGICTLLGVYTRSTIAALLLTMLVWGLVFGLDFVDRNASQVTLLMNMQREALTEQIESVDTQLAGSQASSLSDDQRKKIMDWRQQRVVERDAMIVPNVLSTAQSVVFSVKSFLPKTRETLSLLDRFLFQDKDLQQAARFKTEADLGAITAATQAQMPIRGRGRGPGGPMMGGEVNSTLVLAQVDRQRSIWWIIGTSLLFEAACLALAAWHFCTRDF